MHDTFHCGCASGAKSIFNQMNEVPLVIKLATV